MRVFVNTSKAALLAVLLSVAFAGCQRQGADTTTGQSGATGSASGSSGSAGSTAGGAPATTGPAGSSGASSTQGSSVGNVVDDSVITTKVKTALMADSEIKGSDISVETNKGEVMLSGFVGNQAQIDKAIKVASAVDGVRGVENKMTVKR